MINNILTYITNSIRILIAFEFHSNPIGVFFINVPFVFVILNEFITWKHTLHGCIHETGVPIISYTKFIIRNSSGAEFIITCLRFFYIFIVGPWFGFDTLSGWAGSEHCILFETRDCASWGSTLAWAVKSQFFWMEACMFWSDVSCLCVWISWSAFCFMYMSGLLVLPQALVQFVFLNLLYLFESLEHFGVLVGFQKSGILDFYVSQVFVFLVEL